MSILPQPVHLTGNVLIEEAPVLEPDTRRTIITLHCAIGGCGAVHANAAARTFADLRSDSLGAGWHPGDVCPDPAHENLRAFFAVLAPVAEPAPEVGATALARPYITVTTVPASTGTPEAVATVKRAVSGPHPLADKAFPIADEDVSFPEERREAPDLIGEDVPEETAPDQTSVMEPVTQLVPRVDADGGTR